MQNVLGRKYFCVVKKIKEINDNILEMRLTWKKLVNSFQIDHV